jgi:hypothetical protein
MSSKMKNNREIKKNDIVKCNNKYYTITNIYVNKKNEVDYQLEHVYYRKREPQPLIILGSSCVENVYKDKQHRIQKYVRFMTNYNSVIEKIGFHRYLLETDIDDDMTIISNCGLNTNTLSKMISTLKTEKISSLELHNIIVNPYDFINESYQLITFEKAEKICEKYNLNIPFHVKCEKWPYDLIGKFNSFYITKDKFNFEFNKFCKKNCKDVKDFIQIAEKMVIQIKINGVNYKTTRFLLSLEKDISDNIMDLYYDSNDGTSTKYNISIDEIENEILKFEKQQAGQKKDGKYKLEDDQKKAVIESLINKLNIITGYPGTGKTEIVKCILYVTNNLYKSNHGNTKNTCYINEENNNDEDSLNFDDFMYDEFDDTNEIKEMKEVEFNKYINPSTISLLAPTGLAFMNLSTTQIYTQYNKDISGTCHRILYNKYNQIRKCKKECTCNGNKCKNEISINQIILDETSMIDIFLLRDLIKMCKYFSCRLILLGDNNQLQSIGPGKVLNSFIESEIFNVNKLIKIKRQENGALVSSIKKMNETLVTTTDFSDETFVFLDVNNFITKDNTINTESLINLINTNGLNKNNTKALTYYNSENYVFNCNSLNNIFQSIFNPSEANKSIVSGHKYYNNIVFKEKDNIIRTENDYTKKGMHANGEQAYIKEYNEVTEEITVEYIGENIKAEKINRYYLYENFSLSYCLTVHKSQGSQFDNIIIFIEPNLPVWKMAWDKTALYTGISRARKRCFIISNYQDFINIQKNNKKVDERVSLLLKVFNKYEF